MAKRRRPSRSTASVECFTCGGPHFRRDRLTGWVCRRQPLKPIRQPSRWVAAAARPRNDDKLVQELLARISQLESQLQRLLPQAQQRPVCRFWARGRCTRADRCWFQHPPQPASSSPASSPADAVRPEPCPHQPAHPAHPEPVRPARGLTVQEQKQPEFKHPAVSQGRSAVPSQPEEKQAQAQERKQQDGKARAAEQAQPKRAADEAKRKRADADMEAQERMARQLRLHWRQVRDAQVQRAQEIGKVVHEYGVPREARVIICPAHSRCHADDRCCEDFVGWLNAVGLSSSPFHRMDKDEIQGWLDENEDEC